jgi:hypothetical protein
MTLYSADVLDLAKPVLDKKVKKGKKAAATGEVETVPEPEVVETVEEAPKKKVPTEKQLAALAKAQETRKRKREEEELAKAEVIRLEQVKREEEEQAANVLLAKKVFLFFVSSNTNRKLKRKREE